MAVHGAKVAPQIIARTCQLFHSSSLPRCKRDEIVDIADAAGANGINLPVKLVEKQVA
jgi:hypothetical protein